MGDITTTGRLFIRVLYCGHYIRDTEVGEGGTAFSARSFSRGRMTRKRLIERLGG
jgi:hypothetical protein